MLSQIDKRALPSVRRSTGKEDADSQRRFNYFTPRTTDGFHQIPDMSCTDFRQPRRSTCMVGLHNTTMLPSALHSALADAHR
jgi:hypothetical protein